MNIGLLADTRFQNEGNMKVKHKFSTDLFRKCLQLSLIVDDETYILSVEHGLLSLDDRINDYNLSIDDFGEDDKRFWSLDVANQIKDKIEKGNKLIFYAGERYYKYLIPLLADYDTEIKMDGLITGERVEYLNKQLDELVWSKFL